MSAKSFDKAIGQRIKEARLQKGMTQKELAEKMKMTPAAISQFEKKTSITWGTLEKFAEALSVDPKLLAFGTDFEKPIKISETFAFKTSDISADTLPEAEIYQAITVANMTNKLKSISCNLIDEGSGSYSILCSDGEIHVNIDELDELNKETDEFLEFKLNQLKTRSHFIEYASSEDQKESLPDDQEGNDDTTE